MGKTKTAGNLMGMKICFLGRCLTITIQREDKPKNPLDNHDIIINGKNYGFLANRLFTKNVNSVI